MEKDAPLNHSREQRSPSTATLKAKVEGDVKKNCGDGCGGSTWDIGELGVKGDPCAVLGIPNPWCLHSAVLLPSSAGRTYALSVALRALCLWACCHSIACLAFSDPCVALSVARSATLSLSFEALCFLALRKLPCSYSCLFSNPQAL